MGDPFPSPSPPSAQSSSGTQRTGMSHCPLASGRGHRHMASSNVTMSMSKVNVWHVKTEAFSNICSWFLRPNSKGTLKPRPAKGHPGSVNVTDINLIARAIQDSRQAVHGAQQATVNTCHALELRPRLRHRPSPISPNSPVAKPLHTPPPARAKFCERSSAKWHWTKSTSRAHWTMAMAGPRIRIQLKKIHVSQLNWASSYMTLWLWLWPIK